VSHLNVGEGRNEQNGPICVHTAVGSVAGCLLSASKALLVLCAHRGGHHKQKDHYGGPIVRIHEKGRSRAAVLAL